MRRNAFRKTPNFETDPTLHTTANQEHIANPEVQLGGVSRRELVISVGQ